MRGRGVKTEKTRANVPNSWQPRVWIFSTGAEHDACVSNNAVLTEHSGRPRVGVFFFGSSSIYTAFVTANPWWVVIS